LLETLEAGLEIVQGRAGRREELLEVLPDLSRLGGDRRDVVHVGRVLRPLLVLAAAVDPEDEHDRQEDRARDQERQAKEP
jgi:hypothetical protein